MVEFSRELFIHCYVARDRATLVPARMRANGNFSDTNLEQLHSVSIIVTYKSDCCAKLFYCWCFSPLKYKWGRHSARYKG